MSRLWLLDGQRSGAALHDRENTVLLNAFRQHIKNLLLRFGKIVDYVIRDVIVNSNENTIGDEGGILELGCSDSDSEWTSKVDCSRDCQLENPEHPIVLDVDCNRVRRGSVDQISHKTSLSGYGADRVSAPMATMEGATSVVGDIVRDGTDRSAPETHDTSVEQSVATGAAQPTPGPHHNPSTDSGSDQR